MRDKQTFETILEKHENMDATGITIPFDVEKVFGAKRVPVKVSINGADYRSTIVRMGGRYVMGVPKKFRDEAGIKGGELILVTMEKDTAPRIITPPEDFAEALAKNPDAQANWGKLSYTHQKEYARAVEESKREETRRRRIEKSVEMIAAIKSKQEEN